MSVHIDYESMKGCETKLRENIPIDNAVPGGHERRFPSTHTIEERDNAKALH